MHQPHHTVTRPPAIQASGQQDYPGNLPTQAGWQMFTTMQNLSYSGVKLCPGIRHNLVSRHSGTIIQPGSRTEHLSRAFGQQSLSRQPGRNLYPRIRAKYSMWVSWQQRFVGHPGKALFTGIRAEPPYPGQSFYSGKGVYPQHQVIISTMLLHS